MQPLETGRELADVPAGDLSRLHRPDTGLSAASYLRLLRWLDRTDETERNALYQQASRRCLEEPTALNRLHLALVLSSSKRPSRVAEAIRLLAQLLSEQTPMREEFTDLAQIRLSELRQRLALQEQLAQLEQDMLELHGRYTHLKQQHAETQVEVQRLQGRLEEADAKIRALTSIEKSLERNKEKSTP
jgi:chromosome segregation ATPase